MNELHFQKLQEGRKKYQKARTLIRLAHEKKLYKLGVKDIGELTQRELFLCGVILYWAEGFKHSEESALGLATLDPKMAKFYVEWVEKILGISRANLMFRVTANEVFVDNVGQFEDYWAKFLGVEKCQFTKPFFQRVKQKRDYKGRGGYNGVLRIRVRRSLDVLRRMRGWIDGFSG